jgi:hypothetical protein
MTTIEVPIKTAQSGVKVTTGKLTTVVLRLASVELLVGGPYVKNGEEHTYGHVALRVTTTEEDRIFDYGRYGREWGFGSSEGEGMLRVWTNFNAYIASENSYGRVTTGFSYEVPEERSIAVLAHFDQKVAGKTPTPKSRPPTMREYRIEDYHALGPNCTTMTLDGARIAIPSIDRDRASYQQGRGLSFSERSAARIRGWPDHLIMPADLQAMLEASSAVRPKEVRTFGARRR